MTPKGDDSRTRWQAVLDSTPKRGADTFGEVCEQIARTTLFQIKERSGAYFDRETIPYPGQGMLEEVIKRLQERV